MPGKKASSVLNKIAPDNQQERLITIGWIIGFTDGEGCFTVSLIKNPTTRTGHQIFPEFVVTQGEKSISVLKKMQKFFNCGKIFVNRRHDNHKENLHRYCVRSIKDLNEKIIPFFIENELRTDKKRDFKNFAIILNMMKKKKHLSKKGCNTIKQIIGKMNRSKGKK